MEGAAAVEFAGTAPVSANSYWHSRQTQPDPAHAEVELVQVPSLKMKRNPATPK